MKNYFDFTLTGKKFLPVWLVYLFLVIYPYSFFYNAMKSSAEAGATNPLYSLMVFGIMIVGLLIAFFMIKITIEHISYSDQPVRFRGDFGTYLGKSLLGGFLTCITFTIYMAWFIKDITKFFVNKSSLNEAGFEFQGKGGKLFLYLLVSLLIPFVLIFTLVVSSVIVVDETKLINVFIVQGIIMIVMIPYMYLVYKWMVDINYKDYHISWHTEFGPACLIILGQVLLSVVTLGIYAPLAYLKLYQYFAERTVAESPEKTLHFGYELDAKNDFLFIWGQILLTIVTVCIYYPWAYSKIGKRVLSKTYSEVVEA